MAYSNWVTMTMRASAATGSGVTSGQDTAITLPGSVQGFFILVQKTAEANADNELTVRMQQQIGSDWFDMSFYYLQSTVSVSTAGDSATTTTRAPNFAQEDSTSAFTRMGYFTESGSRTIRDIWIASGTTVSHTFSVTCIFKLNQF